jgi:D-serine deaminase-like pyridoxal phosphate-dependent protein
MRRISHSGIMTVDQLSTPCLLVDERRLEANIRRMAEKTQAQAVGLRPHTKTHKSVDIASRQRQAGAKGLTVAKVGEAEVFAGAGFDDIVVAYPVVGRDKYERIAQLARDARIAFTVDTEHGIRAASEWFSSADRTASVLLEIDSGHGRCGAQWDGPEVVEFARLIHELDGLNFFGLLTHAGHSYAGPGKGEERKAALERVSREEQARILSAAGRLREAGMEPGEISVGSTPTSTFFEPIETRGLKVTEIRPGNYVFLDMMQVHLGSADLANCALTVLSTVVSKHRDRNGTERVFLDAGRKVLTSDGGFGCVGFGQILYNTRVMTPLPHAVITGLSEEHAWVTVRGGATLDVGDRVHIVPNHACVVVNTQDEMVLVREGEVVGTLPVDARGRVR